MSLCGHPGQLIRTLTARNACSTKIAMLLGNEPLRIITINTAEDDDNGFEFPSSFAPKTGSPMDRNSQATEPWQPHGCLPLTFDPENQLLYQAPGGRSRNQAEYL